MALHPVVLHETQPRLGLTYEAELYKTFSLVYSVVPARNQNGYQIAITTSHRLGCSDLFFGLNAVEGRQHQLDYGVGLQRGQSNNLRRCCNYDPKNSRLKNSHSS